MHQLQVVSVSEDVFVPGGGLFSGCKVAFVAQDCACEFAREASGEYDDAVAVCCQQLAVDAWSVVVALDECLCGEFHQVSVALVGL